MNYNKDKFLSILNKLKESFGSQNKMAEALGISSSYITKIYDENTKNPPAPEYLKKIADNSKGVTTYDELMAVCGYQTENMETFVFNIYKEFKRFADYIKSNDTDSAIDIKSTISTFLKYLEKLSTNIYDEDEDGEEIFLWDMFYNSNIIDDFGYIIGFMLLYDGFLKYLEKANCIKIINYEFKNWFNKDEIYYIMNNYKKIILFSYSNTNFEIIDKNSIIALSDKIDEFSNYLTLCIINDFDGKNLLSILFKQRVDETINNTEQYETQDNNTNNYKRIPVLGSIPAGIPIELIQDVIDYEDISEEMLKGGKEYFALKVKGTSMWPKYLDGDTIIVLKQNDCESGQDAIVMVNGDDGTFKRVIKKDTGITLEPINQQEYNSVSYSNEDIEKLPIKILGVVKEIRRKI